MEDTRKKYHKKSEREKAKSLFQLEAITLRGIGSYFHEARLEIKPLTILCGQNGSGKSTWFKVLNYLRQSSNDVLFPLLSLQEGLPLVSDCPSILNNLVMMAAEDSSFKGEYKPIVDGILSLHNPEEAYGPLGSIGLEITALRDCHMDFPGRKTTRKHKNHDDIKNPESQELFDFFEQGIVKRGSKFILRFSFKSGFWDGPNHGPDEITRIDLYKDDALVFRVLQKDLIINARVGDLWLHSKSSQEGLDILPFGIKQLRDHLDIKGRASYEPKFTDEELQELHARVIALCTNKRNTKYRLLLNCLNLFKVMMKSTVDGTFVLSATRSRLDDMNDTWWHNDEIDNLQDNVRSRYIGEFGEKSIQMERAYAKTPMMQLGDFCKDDGNRIFKKKMEEFRCKDDLSAEEIESIRKDILGEDTSRSDSFLSNPTAMLFLMSERILPGYFNGAMSYFTPVFMQYWLCYLGISSSYWFDESGRGFNDFKRPPTGFHAYQTPEKIDPLSSPFCGDEGATVGTDVNRYKQGPLCFPSGVTPLSSGFHHVFPILVQSAVMWPREVFCVDSPEVHLHPSSILKISEFFITQARGGRRFILETHSDLVVRRTLRAILEEEMSQHEVNIYFTSLERIDSHEALTEIEDPLNHLGSTLELIKVNERGQIANWPEGFLDADVVESRRLIDAMYGDIDADDQEQDHGE